MTDRNEIPIWSAEKPWTKEQIVSSMFQDLVKTLQTIESLPGAEVFSELESLHLSLRIFLDANYDLFSSIKNNISANASGFVPVPRFYFCDTAEIS